MRKPFVSMATMLAATILVPSVAPAAEPARQAAEPKTLNVLFIGNSFTACHNWAQVVKAMADLQRIAWEGLQQFQQLAASAGPR